jgi:hypothetical protein
MKKKHSFCLFSLSIKSIFSYVLFICNNDRDKYNMLNDYCWNDCSCDDVELREKNWRCDFWIFSWNTTWSCHLRCRKTLPTITLMMMMMIKLISTSVRCSLFMIFKIISTWRINWPSSTVARFVVDLIHYWWWIVSRNKAIIIVQS